MYDNNLNIDNSIGENGCNIVSDSMKSLEKLETIKLECR